MSTALQPFDFAGQQVRVVTDSDGEPWFVAADVAAILDLGNARSSLALLDEDEKGVHSVDTPGGRQQVTTVCESGLYSLVLRSRKEEARTFKRWITRDVLPAIRRTGSYVAPMTDRDRALALAHEVIALSARVDELEPKALVADKLLTADGDLSVADTAKALTRAGIKVGAGRLFNALAERRWIYRAQGDGRWRVMQTAIDGGWMTVLPSSHYHPKTGVLVLDPPQPRVTPKGLQRLLREHGADSTPAVSA